MNAVTAPPFDRIETIFFDVGNTLVGIDYSWVAGELQKIGESTDATRLEHADAIARPRIGQRLLEESEAEGEQLFAAYLEEVLQAHVRLGAQLCAAPGSLAEKLAPVLRGPGRTQRLWSHVLPGVPQALARIKEAGFQLLVVSNSDGSVEDGLRSCGLLQFFEAVVDSYIVGFEKPDRRIFEHALALANARPETTLHVGDLYQADVLGARGAGIHPALLDPAGAWDQVDCQRFRSVAELGRDLCEVGRGSL
jgi:HAD superfamily hydrolase (TIGR01509 family)